MERLIQVNFQFNGLRMHYVKIPYICIVMKKMMSVLIIFLFCLSGNSQINATYWGVADTNLVISKTTDFGTVHDYIELFNYSGQDLDMRWIANYQPDWPSLWTCDFTDPGGWHQGVQQLDSADFLITDPIGFQNKLIIGVAHFSQAGYGTVDFKVFPVNYPDDFLVLHYSTEITQGNATAGAEAVDSEALISIRNLGDKSFAINQVTDEAELCIYNISGSKVVTKKITENAIIRLSDLPTGMYFIQIRQKSGRTITEKIIV